MNQDLLVYLLHIFVIGTLFLYVGIRRSNIPKIVFLGLLVIGIVIVLYHTYESYLRRQLQKPYWINMLHILLFGPLLIYIGYYGVETERMYFEFLLMTGFAVIGYHSYYAVFSEGSK